MNVKLYRYSTWENRHWFAAMCRTVFENPPKTRHLCGHGCVLAEVRFEHWASEELFYYLKKQIMQQPSPCLMVYHVLRSQWYRLQALECKLHTLRHVNLSELSKKYDTLWSMHVNLLFDSIFTHPSLHWQEWKPFFVHPFTEQHRAYFYESSNILM